MSFDTGFCRTIVFSHFKLEKGFKYKKLFQFYPIDKDVQQYNYSQHYPIILEFKYQKEPCKGNQWYQELFEKDRYRELKNGNEKLDDNKEWLEAHRISLLTKRGNLIAHEIVYLLNLFLNKSIFFYNTQQQWVTPLFDNSDNKTILKDEKSSWGSNSYNPVEKVSSEPVFNPIELFNDDEYAEFYEYYKELRNSINLNKENYKNLTLPSGLNQIFDAYFNMKKGERKIFFYSLRNFYHAERISNEINGYGFMAFVMAIESIGKFNKMKSSSNKDADNLAEKFVEFMCKYTGRDEDETKSQFKKIYKYRSDVAHGKMLRQDMADSGFYMGDEDYEPDVQYIKQMIQIAIINWFIKNHIK